MAENLNLGPAALLILVLILMLAGCGSSNDDEGGTAPPDDSSVAADPTSTTSEPEGVEPETPEETASSGDAACVTGTRGEIDEFVTISFVANEPGRADYWVRIAEPSGDNDSLFQIAGVTNGTQVQQTSEIVGAPTDCTVIEFDPEASQVENLDHITGCTVIESDIGLDADVAFTNTGAETATYVYEVAFYDADGVRVLSQGGSVDGVEAGGTAVGDARTGQDFDASYRCEGVLVIRR